MNMTILETGLTRNNNEVILTMVMHASPYISLGCKSDYQNKFKISD
jgi:hypothetical protein